MKKLLLAFAGVAGLVVAGSFAHAEDDEAVRDHAKIEQNLPGGAQVTIVAGTDAAEAETASVRSEPKPEQAAEIPAALAAPHKSRLAVLPAIFSEQFHPVFQFSEKIEMSGQLNLKTVFTSEHESRMEAPSFTLSLTEAFVASRKFDVLERARLKETLKEIDFGESDYADSSKAVPMGLALNAEYVVLPEIEVIHLVTEVKDVPYVDVVQPRLKGKMIARVRVVDTASTKVVSAGTEEVQVERKLKADNAFMESELNNLVIDLYKAASLRLLHRTLEAIYPVRLVDVAGGKVVLNRGEGSIGAGDEFEVYSLGKAYADPDTGEALGQGETKIATVKVVRIFPKFAEAEILEGAEALTGEVKDFLCRETAGSIESKVKLEEKPVAW